MIHGSTREDELSGLDGRSFDVVVIGGGINGAGVARDATLRGLRVCLLEQGDFASGTSSRSTKIAHGGLRYLKQFDIALVWESQQERRVLRKLLPHLVWPQSFCYPVYRGDPDPLWRVRAGLTLYDALASFSNPERHRRLGVQEALAANPGLRREGLTGAVRYWDDRMDDARICLENVLSARRGGAVCLNYARVDGLRLEADEYRVSWSDVLTNRSGDVCARVVVNCAGPWSDAVNGIAGGALRLTLMRTKGVHLVVPRLPLEDALILPDAADGRPFFVIPWGRHSLIGTTDTRFEGDPATVAVEQDDVDYLLRAAERYLPDSGLSAADVSFAYAGVRPLVAPSRADLPEGRISRRHRIAVREPGLVTLVGGKFTTYRRMAEETTDRVVRLLGARRRGTTRGAPFFAESPPSTGPDGDDALWTHLRSTYGPRAGEVYDLCLSDEHFRRPVVESSPVVLGQLAFGLLAEGALSLDDLVFRRTRLAWEREVTPAVGHRIVDALEKLFPEGTDLSRRQADALGARSPAALQRHGR